MDDNSIKVYEFISNKTCTLAYINLHHKEKLELDNEMETTLEND